MLKSGLYELLLNKSLAKFLEEQNELFPNTCNLKDLDQEFLLELFSQTIKTKAKELLRKQPLNEQVRIFNNLIQSLNGSSLPQSDPKLLKQLSTKKELITTPSTRLSQTVLFTGGKHQLHLFEELRREIMSADSIDFLVSFIRDSGLNIIFSALKDFTAKGHKLRILTTTYMGVTEASALEKLATLSNCEIKINYDKDNLRLHAKAYIFRRESGFSTAYIGSSNLSYSALNEGLEWNIKLSKQQLPETYQSICDTFETYLENPSFKSFSLQDAPKLEEILKKVKCQKELKAKSPTVLKPLPFQEQILDRLWYLRDKLKQYHNLVVAATGTGKTVICAFDFKIFASKLKSSDTGLKKYPTLLFVAHRKELLEQALLTFRKVLDDKNFGLLATTGSKIENPQALFISVQLLNSRKIWEQFAEDYFSYLVVDEFHHAAASSYQGFLNYFKPKILLGLTATPERMDGLDISKMFNHQYAVTLRLPDAINQGLLCPFEYFVISDLIDLSEVEFKHGDYDQKALETSLTCGQKAFDRIDLIKDALENYAPNSQKIKALGFCVSIKHAKFMALEFAKAGFKCDYLTGMHSEKDRENARQNLASGKINFLFVVDLYNEGVDIKEINTLLFLRPTNSLTIFLQQLGRGLRLCEGKDCVTVLDFVGHANQKYNFHSRFNALFTTRRESPNFLIEQEKQGFSDLPQNCYLVMEQKAQQIIFEHLKKAIKDSQYQVLIDALADFLSSQENVDPSLIDLSTKVEQNVLTLYQKKKTTLGELLIKAKGLIEEEKPQNFITPFYDEHKEIRDFFLRLSQTFNPSLNDFIRAFISGKFEDFDKLSDHDRALFKVLFRLFSPNTIYHTPNYVKYVKKPQFDKLKTYFKQPFVSTETLNIIDFKEFSQEYQSASLPSKEHSLLNYYGVYTRYGILTSLGCDQDGASMREGVKYIKEIGTDVFFITLNKEKGRFTQRTRYDDYLIDQNLIHVKSQNQTKETSDTAKRYFDPKSKILLCVRVESDDPYTVLGFGQCVKHEGSGPISLTYKLDRALPYSLYAKFTNF